MSWHFIPHFILGGSYSLTTTLEAEKGLKATQDVDAGKRAPIAAGIPHPRSPATHTNSISAHIST